MYQIISEDVTLFDGDAVLNSLGYGEKRIVEAPGGVFRSLLARVGKPESLKKEVYDNGAQLPFFQAFVTDSFGLRFKKIVHVISPYRDKDDKEVDLLKDAYLNALQVAYDAGIRSICLPLIGTGANGYSSEESFKAARKMAHEFGLSHEDFNIYLTVFWGDRVFYEEERIRRRREGGFQPNKGFGTETGGRRRRYAGIAPAPMEPLEPRLGCPIDTPRIDMDLLNLQVGDSFGRLIDLFIIARDGNDSKSTLDEGWKEIAEVIGEARDDFFDGEDSGLGGNFKYMWHKHADAKKGIKKTPGIKHGEEDPNGIWATPKKIAILLVACALNMNRKQTEFLFRFCGYYLSAYNNEDLAIKACYEYLATETEDAAILSVYQLYAKKSGKTPFVKREDPFKK